MSRAAAPDLPAPMRLLHVAELDSTNAEAMRLAAAGEPGPLWVLADRQRAGRGRSGRSWTSLPGNLHASLLLLLSCGPAEAAQLSLLAGLAAIEAIEARAAPGRLAGLRLKWPNDILIGGAKLGGILVESARAGPEGRLAASVGIGIDLTTSPPDLGRAATSLAAHGLAVDPLIMLETLAWAVHRWLLLWDEGRGFAHVREAWLSRAGPIGERVVVALGARTVAGGYRGIDAGGALLVVDDAGIEQRVTYGDVTVCSRSREHATEGGGA